MYLSDAQWLNIWLMRSG